MNDLTRIDWFLIAILIVNVIGILVLIFKKTKISFQSIEDEVEKQFKENRAELSTALSQNRTEQLDQLERNRKELAGTVHDFQLALVNRQKETAEKQQVAFGDLQRLTKESLLKMMETVTGEGKSNREEQLRIFDRFNRSFTESVDSFNQLQKEKFDVMNQSQLELVKKTEQQLEKMRATVDEKLHKTLEERLGHSFKQVSQHLVQVQEGLGEMKNLATGVGDLKKVLSNVKTRGVVGEIQLGAILEEILTPDQYAKNIKTKRGSNDHVEYAVKLPGRDIEGEAVYLPIDAKFHQEDYIRLQDAYEAGDKAQIESATKALVSALRLSAKTIQQKYVDPPYTTNFAVLFLPTEGLYAEAMRQPGLMEELQRTYLITLAGPSTLAALMNSFQMGFRTLAIEKHSADVWKTLSVVKKEFMTFGGVLEKAQKKLREADGEIEKLVTTRTNQMMRKLKDVEQVEQSTSMIES